MHKMSFKTCLNFNSKLKVCVGINNSQRFRLGVGGEFSVLSPELQPKKVTKDENKTKS